MDVMDGHFVPNLTFGPPVVNAFRIGVERPLTIHLMVDAPGRLAPRFHVREGDLFIAHLETAKDARPLLARLRSTGAGVGLSLRPRTPIKGLFHLLEAIDLVLVMSVEPGFGGQRFLPESIDRIRRLRQEIADRPVAIGVDGGINRETAPDVLAAGAEILVVGSAIFGADDPARAAAALVDAVT
jgi:ribulose-phosphate 3-epimerase